jgi:MFS family permease
MEFIKPRSMATLFVLQVVLLQSLMSTVMSDDSGTVTDTKNVLTYRADKIEWIPAIIAVIAIALGLILHLQGYKMFLPAVAIAGFILGGLIIAGIMESLFEGDSGVVVASWIGFIIGGLIIAALAVMFYDVGVFVVGAIAGFLLASIFTTTVGYLINPDDPDTILIIFAIIFGLIGGLLALKFEKPAIILATSFAGAVMVVWGIGYFLGKFPNSADLKSLARQTQNGDLDYDIPGAWWLYLLAIIILTILGYIFQDRQTKGEILHSRHNHGNYRSVQTPNGHHHA